MGVAIVVPGVDFRDNNLGQVTPSRTLALESLSIVGPDSVYINAKYNARLVPTFTTQRSVTWSITSGNQYATIDSSGNVSVRPNVSGQSVTIRCTSALNPSIYAEKTIQVVSSSVAYFDWVMGDGTDFIVMPGLAVQRTGKVTVWTTHTGANTYTFMCQYASNSSQARIASYNNSSNKVSAYIGDAGPNNYTNKDNSIIYRYEWNLGVNNDGSFYLYNNATSAVMGSRTGAKIEMSGLVWIFRYGVGASSQDLPSAPTTSLTPNGAKFYSMTVVDGNNNLLAEYKPAMYGGEPGVYDTVSGVFRGGFLGTGGLSCGND